MAEARIKITEKPTTSSVKASDKVFMNVNGELVQTTVDNVVNNSTLKTTVDNTTKSLQQAINNMANLTEIVNSKANGIVCKSTGSPLLLTDSANGVAIDFEVKGRSTQTQYSGKNLLDCSGLSPTTLNGITFTPVYDDNGSLLYVNVNGTATGSYAYTTVAYNITLPSGTYILSGCPSGGSESTYRMYTNSAIYIDYGNGKEFTLDAEYTFNNVVIFIAKGYTANNLKFYPMISTEGGEYEPYTNGASPNPSYPQAIKSVGDMGYFDGELLQGFYDGTTGVYKTARNWVCSADPIPCTSGDIVNVEYSEVVTSMTVAYYDENMTYISYRGLTNVSSVSVTIPSNAKYFYININTSAITPQTAKHICVTINGKYALIEKSVGKNLLDNIATDSTSNGITVTVNDNKSINVKGTANVQSSASKWVGVCDKTLPRGSYILSGSPSGASSNSYSFYINIGSASGVIISSDYTFTLTEDTTVKVQLRIPLLGQTIDATFYPMIRPQGTDATYEPYKESRKYIPISAPLRGLGEVTDVASLSECEVDRKFAEVVFDGSADERWLLNMTTGYTSVFYTELLNFTANNLDRSKVVCDHYIVKSFAVPMDYDYLLSIGTYINVRDKRFTTVDEFKTWLQSNPITVIYELAEPTTESIEPIDVDTFEGVTHISVSDNADMEVEYPADTKTYIDNKISETVATLYSAILNA